MMRKDILSNKWTWIIIALAAFILIGMFAQKNYDVFVITGTETMTRASSASSISPSSTFTLTYSAQGVSGNWGATILDSVSGGCTFPSDLTTYNDALISDMGNSKQVIVKAPASGSCTFSGDYKFGSMSTKQFNSLTITVTPTTQPCTPVCTGKVCGDNGCGGSCGTCTTGKICSETGTCVIKTCSGTTCDNKNETISDQWCSIASQAGFIPITKEPCTDGTIIIAGGLVILLLLLKK